MNCLSYGIKKSANSVVFHNIIERCKFHIIYAFPVKANPDYELSIRGLGVKLL